MKTPKVLLLALAIPLLSTPLRGQIVSEFMAENEGILLDVDGAASDWIEIFNNTAAPIPLSGWFLTDNLGNLTKWTIPAITIPAGGYQIIFASGKDRANPAAELHTSFSLSANGEDVALVRPNGTIASQFAAYPAQTGNVSYGTQGGSTGFMCATPGAANTATGTDPCQLTCSTVAPSSQIVISEFAASQTTVFDRDNASSDWIELRNTGGTDFLMHDWHLTDCSGNLRKWRIPDITIPANGFYVLFASGKNLINDLNELHTSFSLAQSGEYLGLVRPDGLIANQFSPTFPPQTTDISYGTQGGTTGFMCPTPQAANTSASGTPPVLSTCAPVGLAAPTFTQPHGFFGSSMSVGINCTIPGASLYYTVDGSAPTKSNPNATRVDAPNATTAPSASVAISTTTILRAIVTKGILTSRSFSQTYIFTSHVVNQPDNRYSLPSLWPNYSLTVGYGIDTQVTIPAVPENGFSFEDSLVAIPTLSISSDQAGLLGTAGSTAGAIYPNSLGEDERAASAELIYPNGSAGFQINCGIKLHGGFSRNHEVTPKHSFDLLFSSTYGPTTLNFPLFSDTPVTSFNRLVLRACATDSWSVSPGSAVGNDSEVRWVRAQATYMRDQWMRDSQLTMGHLSPHGTYVHLYLNGLYWGLYNISERVEGDFAASYLGGLPSDYDVVDVSEPGNVIVPRGASSDLTEWLAMMGAAGVGTGGTAGNDAAYLRLRGWSSVGVRNTAIPVYLNMQNFIDYMILHIVSRADDWPVHNWFAVRREDSPGQFDSDGFRFIEWDQELSNMSLNDNHISWSPFMSFQTVNHNGPALLYDLLRRNSPLFQAEFKQRVLALMSGTGPLTPVANHQRWLRRANEIDRAILGEAARWGDERETQAQAGEVFPFTRKHWLANTSYLLNNYWHENLTAGCNRFSGLTPSLLPDPFIVQTPKSQTVQEGTTAAFVATGSPTGVTYEWYFNGNLISGASSSSYSIPNVGLQHAGYYSVRIQNANGSRTSDAALLTVVNREEIWLEDATPAGVTLGAQGGDSWNNWVTEPTLKPFSGTSSLQSSINSGFHQLYYTGGTPSSVDNEDILFVYVYLDPANPPLEIMLQWYTADDQTWWHRAYWGGTQIQSLYSYMTGVYMGALPPVGAWVRLEVPARAVRLPGRQISGLALTLYGGRVAWDHAGKRTGGDLLWVDDTLPPGPYVFVTGSYENWRWTADSPRPISGKLAVQSENLSGLHQVYFAGTKDNWRLNSKDVLFANVYLNPGVQEVMLQWVTTFGIWQRAYWGNNLIPVGKTRIGDLPSAGSWVRLEVPVTTLGLQNTTIQGLALSLYGGQATWDAVGKTRRETDTVWFDDQPPTGATLVEQGDSWANWDAVITPVSGSLALHSSTASGLHQMFCYNATATLPVVTGDVMYVNVYLTPGSLPSEIMVQWYTSDGSWAHRAYWGADQISLTPRYQMASTLPPAGKWVRLEMPAALLDLEGKTVTGIALSLYGGTATWDHVGKLAGLP